MLALTGAVLLGAAQSSRAVFAPVFVSVVPEGANFRWTYRVDFGNFGIPFRLTKGNGTLSPGAVGTQDFVTLYDIEGYIPGSVIAPGLHVALSPEVFLGITGPNTLPVDSPTLLNLTLRYDAQDMTTDHIFTGLSFLSQFGDKKNDGSYSSQFTNTGLANTKIGELGGGLVLPKRGVVAVPEPSSLALVGVGAVGLLAFARRRTARPTA